MTTLHQLLLKKKAYGRLCSQVKQNQKGKCNISEVSGFRGQWGGGVQGRTVGSRSPHVLTPVTQQRHDTGSLGTERHPLHGECSKSHLAQSGEMKVGYFVIGSKGMCKQEFFWPS